MLRFFRLLAISSISAAFYASAECSVNTNLFSGALEVVEQDEDGFPIVLASSAELENLPVILLDCDADTRATITISKPSRTKDGGPLLDGPIESFFYVDGERYTHKQSLTLVGEFRDRPIRIGMSLRNGNEILPAGNKFSYLVTLIITVTKAGQVANLGAGTDHLF